MKTNLGFEDMTGDNLNLQINYYYNNNPLILFAHNQPIGDMGIMEIIDYRANLRLLDTIKPDI